MRIVLLSAKFYNRVKGTPEMLDKHDRPYVCVEIRVENRTYAIPIRHNLNHAYGFHTVGNAGIDFTKAVVLDSKSDIQGQAWITREEHDILTSNEDRIYSLFTRFLRQYKRALANPDNPRSKSLLKYSTLQYFDIG